MCDGYEATSPNAGDALDEFLCEYVDGTMDPHTRLAFEEVLYSNPDLLARVEALRHTRALLCHYGGRCPCQAPEGFQVKLQQRLACEMLRSDQPVSSPITHRLQTAVSVASALAVLLVAAVAVGGTFLAEPAAERAALRAVADRPAVALSASPGWYAAPITSPFLTRPATTLFGAAFTPADSHAAVLPLARLDVRDVQRFDGAP